MGIMSSQKLSAYSYMIKDSSCQGIPTQHQERYQQETEKCLKKEILKTPVSKIAEQKKSVFKKHLSEERETKICISKEQVNVCHSSKNPQEIHSNKMQRMAEQGEKIEDAKQYSTSFERDVSEPKRC